MHFTLSKLSNPSNLCTPAFISSVPDSRRLTIAAFCTATVAAAANTAGWKEETSGAFQDQGILTFNGVG